MDEHGPLLDVAFEHVLLFENIQTYLNRIALLVDLRKVVAVQVCQFYLGLLLDQLFEFDLVEVVRVFAGLEDKTENAGRNFGNGV